MYSLPHMKNAIKSKHGTLSLATPDYNEKEWGEGRVFIGGIVWRS